MSGRLATAPFEAPRPAAGVIRWTALGDSFTAGTSADEVTWPRLVLAAEPAGRRLALDNRARVGATVAELIETQLPAALAGRSNLVTVICGGNDVIGSVRPSLQRLDAELDQIWDALRNGLPGAALLTATYPAIAPAALRPRTRERIERGLGELNSIIRAAAERAGIGCVELAGHPGQGDRGNYAEDGIHPSPAGHRQAAAVLGLRIAELIEAQIPEREDEAR